MSDIRIVTRFFVRASFILPTLFETNDRTINKRNHKEDCIKCCQSVKYIEYEYWRRDALMEEEVERIVINIGIVSSDEECDEDEMDYDGPDFTNISPADSPRIEAERSAFTTHQRPYLKTAMFRQTGYTCSESTTYSACTVNLLYRFQSLEAC
ncbi:hypothetical protein ANN_22435 [Periplaneta americana]|uniref:Uncharacterized protein n=1 Tax=Periplaneta americana TaxID=6978 RepID=A0ABQ8S8G3_PERAM|nr:hypothetical protein ANN_22435 [Periplaneta americana]